MLYVALPESAGPTFARSSRESALVAPMSCAASGVKCHVSCDMAVMEPKGTVRLSKNPRTPTIAFIGLRRREWN